MFIVTEYAALILNVKLFAITTASQTIFHISRSVFRGKKGLTFEPRHEISNNVVCATSNGSDQPAHTRSLIRAFACRLNIL